jgi:hypothetical protein
MTKMTFRVVLAILVVTSHGSQEPPPLVLGDSFKMLIPSHLLDCVLARRRHDREVICKARQVFSGVSLK